MMFDASRQRASEVMRAEDGATEPVARLLADLESQADGLQLAERAVEVHELSVAQYAEVELVGRLHASVGRDLRVGTVDGHDLRGRLVSVGADWVSLDDGHDACFVPLAGVTLIGGLARGASPEAARPLAARLSFRSVLRGIAAEGASCAVHLSGGRVLRGVPERVGADFVELAQPEPAPQVIVPMAAIAVVRSGGSS